MDKEIRRGIATVVRSFGKEAEVSKQEELEVRVFETTPAEVGFQAGLTLNLGNYESARIDVILRLPCYIEELDAAYKFATSWCTDRLITERDEILGWKKQR